MKSIFKCNEGGVTEWCVAENKQQAYDFMSNLWGEITMKEYENEYFEDDINTTLDDFIDNFFTEEQKEDDFTIVDAGIGGEPVTMKISEWLELQTVVPNYFCCEQY